MKKKVHLIFFVLVKFHHEVQYIHMCVCVCVVIIDDDDEDIGDDDDDDVSN